MRLRSSKVELRDTKSKKPSAVLAEYDECFEKIGVFRRAVGEEEIRAQPPQSHLILHEAQEW